MAHAQTDERGLTYTLRIAQCQTCGTLEEYRLYRGDVFRQYWHQVCDHCPTPQTFKDVCAKDDCCPMCYGAPINLSIFWHFEET